MSFTGELEHLSIIDVIQLLHTTRKSGILRVRGRKGESQLVFKDGYIVGANHLNNSVRIGTILVDAGLITPDVLEQCLQAQQNAGHDRKPLIVTLLEKGLVNEADAYKGLEHLIELTIVEILTWKRGTFTLDLLATAVSDDYRYYPEKMSREINIDTQSILMDALRIFDEKMRDGELAEEPAEEEAGGELPDAASTISAEDLGLADIDRIERKIPAVFSSLDDRVTGSGLEETALSQREGEELLAFLQKPVRFWAGTAPQGGAALSLILFSADEILTYCITTVCRQEGIHVLACSEEQDLEHIIDQLLTKRGTPLLVIDRPAKAPGLPAGEIASLRQQLRKKYPSLSIIQLAPPLDYPFALIAYKDGVRAVIPAPSLELRRTSFVADARIFLEAFLEYLCGHPPQPANVHTDRLWGGIPSLRELKEPPEVAFALLRFVAEPFERSLTLIVREHELIAERSIGIREKKGGDATPPLGFRIPLTTPSLLRSVIEGGRMFFGPTDDAVLREHLYKAIGAPSSSTVLLLPLRSFGRTIAITYADFGRGEASSVPVELLELLSQQAGLVLENALYRKKRENPAQQPAAGKS